ncbi:hypothetical protein ABZ726_20245 [Streptomyces hundungensis]|uniref:hypothetical protein n=1 Tax=Streptomyces hundungensis TaxID=1077946 RepID=UPI003411617C
MTDGPFLSQIVGGTSEEQNLAEDYAFVLQKFSELQGSVEDANWKRAFEKISSLRSALRDFERRISETTVLDDGEKFDVYRAPNVGGHQTLQLITAFAQQHGGRLGPQLFPIGNLESAAAVEKIRTDLERTRKFREALEAGDEEAASEISGGQVRIVDGMTGDGSQ